MARARSAQTDRDARCRSYDKVSFYFAAHEDDWQLFMNPSAFADVADVGTKVAPSTAIATPNGTQRPPAAGC